MKTQKEKFDELWDDKDTWNLFVEDWIEKSLDEVFEIVNDKLVDDLNRGDTKVIGEFTDFINKLMDQEPYTEADRRYQEMKDES